MDDIIQQERMNPTSCDDAKIEIFSGSPPVTRRGRQEIRINCGKRNQGQLNLPGFPPMHKTSKAPEQNAASFTARLLNALRPPRR